DEKLRMLIDFAIITDASRWIRRGSKLLSEQERSETRADHWRRVWSHLAGKDVVIMGSRGRRPGDGHAWVTAKLTTAPGQSLVEARIVLAWDVEPGVSGVRVLRQQPRASRALYLTDARHLAGRGWSEVAWGEFGSRTPMWTHRVRLPHDRRKAARL